MILQDLTGSFNSSRTQHNLSRCLSQREPSMSDADAVAAARAKVTVLAFIVGGCESVRGGPGTSQDGRGGEGCGCCEWQHPAVRMSSVLAHCWQKPSNAAEIAKKKAVSGRVLLVVL